MVRKKSNFFEKFIFPASSNELIIHTLLWQIKYNKIALKEININAVKF
jgi:hypothetical protein